MFANACLFIPLPPPQLLWKTPLEKNNTLRILKKQKVKRIILFVCMCPSTMQTDTSKNHQTNTQRVAKRGPGIDGIALKGQTMDHRVRTGGYQF